MRKSINMIFFLLIFMTGGCMADISCDVKPEFFCPTFREIEEWVGPEKLTSLESKFAGDPAEIHYVIGQDVRNRLQLWSENDLTRFFSGNGVGEPEKMSYGLTVGIERYRRGETVDMVEICRQLSKPLAPPPPPAHGD